MAIKQKLHMQAVRARHNCRNVFLRLNELLDITNFTGPGFELKRSGNGKIGREPEIKVLKPDRSSEPIVNQPMRFDTGNPPKFGPARAIIDWKRVEVLGPEDDPEKISGPVISQRRAQEEVQKMLKNRDASHQRIAFEGAKLYGGEEASKYTLHMMLGACGEDFVFMPGENMRSIYKKQGARSWQDVHNVLFADVPSLFSGIFRIGARIWRTIVRKPDDDPVNRPYFAHFYDPSRSDGDRGLNILNGDLQFQSALERAQKLWMKASEYYRLGNKPMAYYTLGHVLHLVADMHVPAHVHNDMHGPTLILGRLDSFEGWVKKADHPDIRRGSGRANITIWDSGPLKPPVADSSWNLRNVYGKIAEFMHETAVSTHRFRSVDSKGDALGQQKTGRLTPGECYVQGDVLIPSAITKTAQMIANFVDYHERLGC